MKKKPMDSYKTVSICVRPFYHNKTIEYRQTKENKLDTHSENTPVKELVHAKYVDIVI